MVIKQVKKGEILQRKGNLNSKVFEVESGLLRSYSIDAIEDSVIHQTDRIVSSDHDTGKMITFISD